MSASAAKHWRAALAAGATGITEDDDEDDEKSPSSSRSGAMGTPKAFAAAVKAFAGGRQQPRFISRLFSSKPEDGDASSQDGEAQAGDGTGTPNHHHRHHNIKKLRDIGHTFAASKVDPMAMSPAALSKAGDDNRPSSTRSLRTGSLRAGVANLARSVSIHRLNIVPQAGVPIHQLLSAAALAQQWQEAHGTASAASISVDSPVSSPSGAAGAAAVAPDAAALALAGATSPRKRAPSLVGAIMKRWSMLPAVRLNTHEPHAMQSARTVLEVVVQHDHVDILTLPRMLRVLDSKWRSYARYVFFFRMFFNMAFLGFMFAMALYRTTLPNERRTFKCPAEADPEACRQMLICEVGVIAGTVIKACTTLYRLTRLKTDYRNLRGAALIQSIVSALGWVTATIGFIMEGTMTQLDSRFLFAASSVFAWCHFSYFLLGFKLTGPFVIMVVMMLLSDVVRFIAIMCLVYFGFVNSFMFLATDGSFTVDGDPSGTSLVGGPLLKHLLRTMSLWVLQPEAREESTDAVFLVPTILFEFVAAIVLLNLLVAQFNATFQRVFDASDKRWQLERARIILSIEADIPKCILRAKAFQYWTVIDGKPWLQIEEANLHELVTPERLQKVAQAKQAVIDQGPASACSPRPLAAPASAAMVAGAAPPPLLATASGAALQKVTPLTASRDGGGDASDGDDSD